MALGFQYFDITTDARTLVGELHIKSKAHVGVWLQLISDSSWYRLPASDFDMVNNTVVPDTPISASIYSQARLRIVSEEADL